MSMQSILLMVWRHFEISSISMPIWTGLFVADCFCSAWPHLEGMHFGEVFCEALHELQWVHHHELSTAHYQVLLHTIGQAAWGYVWARAYNLSRSACGLHCLRIMAIIILISHITNLAIKHQ